MLIFDNVTMKYHYEQYPLFSGISFTLTDKQTTVLVDAQSGKTTLCKLILGLEKPTEGRVVFNGVDCSTVKGKDLDATYLCKDLLLFKNKSVLYNVAYPLVLRGDKRTVANAKAQQVVDQFGLDGNAKVKKLSNKQQVDVVLARMVVRNSTLVLLDDFLDVLTQQQAEFVKSYFNKRDCWVVHFTSDPEKAFGKLVLIFDNKVISENIYEEINKILWLQQTMEEK